MQCIFCKERSDDSKSIEHIVPESLGNREHVLPKGIVCDTCNSYFGIKIEKEVLAQGYFKYMRHIQDIETKRGNLVPGAGIIAHPHGGKVEIYKEESGLSINVSSDILRLVATGQVNKLYIPHYEQPFSNNLPLSRLLGKMAVEALVHRLMPAEGWEAEIVDKAELDPLRKYVRHGPGKIKFWPYHQRVLYSPDDDILHEFTFHYSEAEGLFFIIVIFGVEYAINMGGPEIESYLEELKKRGGKSFLSD